MKRFTFSVVLTAVLGLAAYTLADAQNDNRFGRMGGEHPGFFQERGGPGGVRRGPGGRGGPMFALRGLDLTDEQRAQIRTIQQEERGDQRPPADMPLHRQLQAALFADVPDATLIGALQQQLVQAQAARLATQIAVEQKIAQVLTGEQRAQVRERLSKGRGAAVVP